MNDTPETDKATIASGGDWCPVLRETCRRLERERDNEMKWHHQTHKELVETQCKLMDITQERDEARAELHKASVEANALATSIQKAEYSDAKEFELLGSVAGVISQIDNMYAGVRQQRDEARAKLSLKCQSVTIASGTISDLLKKIERFEKQIEGVRRERDEVMEQLCIAVGLLSTQPQFADKHSEDVLAFVKEGAK